MNRQYKRLMQKQEAAKKGQRPQIKPPAAPTKKQRTSPRQFLREVVAEMRKVAWPTRPEGSRPANTSPASHSLREPCPTRGMNWFQSR